MEVEGVWIPTLDLPNTPKKKIKINYVQLQNNSEKTTQSHTYIYINLCIYNIDSILFDISNLTTISEKQQKNTQENVI